MLITMKYISGLNFGDVTLTVLDLSSFGKISEFFVSILLLLKFALNKFSET